MRELLVVEQLYLDLVLLAEMAVEAELQRFVLEYMSILRNELSDC